MKELIRVLYLDDNPHDQELVRDILTEEHSGFNLTICSDRDQFETFLTQEQWDVILSDFNILGYSGLQVIQTVKEKSPDTPVIILTGTGTEEMAVRAMKMGAADYVIKSHSHIQRLGETIYRVLHLAKVKKDKLRAESALIKREKELTLAQKVAQLGSWSYDPLSMQPTWSDEMFKIFGLNPQNHAPHYEEHRNLIHPDDWELFDTALQRAVTDGTGYNLEIRIKRPNGEHRHINTKCEAFKNAQGDIVQLIGTTQDITEHKMAEEELLEREVFLQTLLDAIPVPVFYKDINGKYLGVNTAFEDFFGRKRESLIGKTVFDITRPDLAQIYHDKDMELFNSGGEQQYEAQLLNVHGLLRDVIFNKAVFTDQNGAAIGLIGTIRDITEFNEEEAKRHQVEKQLRQSQRLESIGQLAGGIAHDFNNMLSVILGYGQELLEQFDRGDARWEAAHEIVVAVNRSAALTRQLLAFSRQQTLRPEVLCLNDIVKNMTRLLSRLIREDIQLNLSLAHDLNRVKVDPNQFEQVIMNLATNARDAMPQGGTLSIETVNIELDNTYGDIHLSVVPGHYVMLSISDTGTGIDKDLQKHIFEPFFTTKVHGEGTGLGLATVYGIVKQSNGYIWVYSEPGKETTFKIYLPQTTESSTIKTSPIEFSSIYGEGETILVVEDEPSVRKLCERILIKLNYNVTAAANPIEALRLVEEKKLKLDMVITDIVMPEMNGMELVDHLRNRMPDFRVLYMSGYTDHSIINKGILSSDTHYIQKPFTKANFGGTIRKILAGPK